MTAFFLSLFGYQGGWWFCFCSPCVCGGCAVLRKNRDKSVEPSALFIYLYRDILFSLEALEALEEG